MAKRDNTKKSVGKTSKARAKKTSAASTTKKRTTKKAPTKKSTTTKKTTKKTNKKQANTLQARLQQFTAQIHGLRALHILSAALFAGLIAFLYTVVETIERTAVLTYAARDALREDVLAPAVQSVVTIDLRHAIALGLGIATIYSVYVATKGWKAYVDRSEKGAMASRWVLAAVLAYIGFATAALLVGMFDIVTIKVLGLMLAGSSFLAYQADKETVKQRKSTLFLSAVVLAAVAVAGVTAFIGASMWYGVTLPISVYFAVDVLALGLLGYAVNQLFSFKKRKGFTKPADVERNYVLITTIATLLFTTAVIFGFMA